MSARVFNRFAMSEARAPRGPPPGQRIERARRVLFVEAAQNFNQAQAQARQVAAEELANSIQQKSQQWNFDFSRGVPLDNANSRLKWSKQERTERVPEAYAHERLPYLSTHAESESSEIDVSSIPSDNSTKNSRQSSITEFMPKRKNCVAGGCSKTGSITASSSSGITAVAGSAVSASTSEPPAKKHKTSSS